MAFSKNLKGGRCQKQLKLEVPMVPEEAPRQWMNEYDTQDRIIVNANGKKLLTDSAAQLKFPLDHTDAAHSTHNANIEVRDPHC